MPGGVLHQAVERQTCHKLPHAEVEVKQALFFFFFKYQISHTIPFSSV